MKNYFLLYHDEVKQGLEGVSFYYSDVERKLYLRYARFQKGMFPHWYQVNIQKKTKKATSKAKRFMDFHCCGFAGTGFLF